MFVHLSKLNFLVYGGYFDLFCSAFVLFMVEGDTEEEKFAEGTHRE